MGKATRLAPQSYPEWSHAPPDYECPLCRIARGLDNEGGWTKRSDVVHRDDVLTAFISAKWWPGNPGHVIIIPNAHFENIYEMPDGLLAAIASMGKRVAIALKTAYGCDATSLRQHNEPAGNQDVWHYHLHVFPRYTGDELYVCHEESRLTTPAERDPYARKLRRALASIDPDSGATVTNISGPRS